MTTLSKSIINAAEFSLLQQHPVPSWIIKADDFSIIFCNKAAAELAGSDEDANNDFLQFFSEKSRIVLLGKATKHSKELNGVYRLMNEREPAFVELFANTIQYKNILCWQVSCIDITERVNESGFLKEDSKRYKTYIDYSADGIYCQEFSIPLNCNTGFEETIHHARKFSHVSECNNAMARMYGFEKADDLKGILSEHLLDFDAPVNYGFFKAFIDNGFKIINAVSQEKDRHGNTKYFLNSAIGVIENGFLKRIWGTQQDITERKKTEEKLQLLANLVEQTSDILTAADVNYIPITWNKAAEKIYGISSQQIIGNNIRDFLEIHYGSTTQQEVRKIIEIEGEWTGEAWFIRPTDNKRVTLMISFKKMTDENDLTLGYLVSAKDISDRKEAECKLRESENRFREMADSSPVMIWMTDENSNVTYTNSKWMEFTGKKIVYDEVTIRDLIHEGDRARAVHQYNIAYEQKKDVTIVYRLLHKDGQYRWVHDVSVPRFSGEKFVGYIGSVVDIEEQKQRELQLHYQATILENVSDVIVTTDLEFKVISLNPSAEFYYGITEAEAKGKIMSDLLNLEFEDSSPGQLIHSLQFSGFWKGEISLVASDGERKYFLNSLKELRDELNRKIGYMAVGKDITEMKLAQEKVKESETFYRTLIADSLDGMILVDAEARIKFASPSVKKILGYEVDEAVGRFGFDFIHPEDILTAAQSFESQKTEAYIVKSIVARLLKKNGDWIWCLLRGHNMMGTPGVNSIVIYFHDYSYRQKASEALKESEQRFRNLIRDLQVGVFLTDRKNKVLICNKALSEMASMEQEEIIGKHINEIIDENIIDEHGKYIPVNKRPLALASINKTGVNDFVIGVKHPVKKNLIWLMINCSPVLDEHGDIIHIVSSMLDITARKKLEQKLMFEKISHQKQITRATIDGQEAERKEIGKELHDNIGQQLTTIKLFLDIAHSTADDSTNEMVILALKGVSDVINEIRAMSRSLVPSTLQDLGLVESINELVDSFSRAQLMDMQVSHLNFDEDLLPESQKLTIFRMVQEQLNNIVKHSGARNVEISLRSNKNEILLQIKDDGCGFDPKKIKRGLGFINIANRAELFGGSNKIMSSPGMGCTLKVRFPHPKLVNINSSHELNID